MSYINSATKEFSVVPQDGGAQVSVGNWYLFSLTSIGELNYTFRCPNDFKIIVEAKIMIVPDNTETIQWDIDASVSADGEAYNNDNRSQDNQTLGVTNDQVAEIDIIGVLGSMVANDWVGIRFQSDTANIRCGNLFVRYK